VPPYSAYTAGVELLPLTLSGATVVAGPAVPLLATANSCTRVLFAVGAGTHVLLGLKDRNGRRLIELQP
jgi:hypothetical protein